MDLEWSLVLKASIMIVGIFGISWSIYEFLIRRRKYVRPFFGLKVKHRNIEIKGKYIECVFIMKNSKTH